VSLKSKSPLKLMRTVYLVFLLSKRVLENKKVSQSLMIKVDLARTKSMLWSEMLRNSPNKTKS
jgi:hypothetical protein